MAPTGREVPRLPLGFLNFRSCWLKVAGALLIVVSVVAFAPAFAASKKGRFATREEVAQVWIGLTADGRSVVRLVLHPDGRGLGGEALLDGQLQTFRIPRWSYSNGKITIATEPLKPVELEVGALSGSVIGLRMDLSMRGHGWVRPMSLRREVDLEEPWLALKAKMEQVQPDLRE